MANRARPFRGAGGARRAARGVVAHVTSATWHSGHVAGEATLRRAAPRGLRRQLMARADGHGSGRARCAHAVPRKCPRATGTRADSKP